MDDLQRWVFALLFSLFFGHFVTDLFVHLLRKPKESADPEEIRSFESFLERQKPKIIKEVPAALIGILERFFFTVLIGAKVNGAGVAMMTWLAVKMASNWNRVTSKKADARVYGMSALAGGMLSMIFALIGGLICRDSTCWWCFTDRRLTMYPKLIQAIPLFLTLIGTFLVAFGLKIKEGAHVKQHPILFSIGLLFLSAATIFQLWLLFCFS